MRGYAPFVLQDGTVWVEFADGVLFLVLERPTPSAEETATTDPTSHWPTRHNTAGTRVLPARQALYTTASAPAAGGDRYELPPVDHVALSHGPGVCLQTRLTCHGALEIGPCLAYARRLAAPKTLYDGINAARACVCVRSAAGISACALPVDSL